MKKGSHSTPFGHTRMKQGKEYERKVRQAYENAGFIVISAGLPDLLCVRSAEEIVFVECKSGKAANLRPCQKQAIKLLRGKGLTVIVQKDTTDIHVPSPLEVREYLPLIGSSYRVR